MVAKTDAQWMQRALELARQGSAAPNPHVGCVIVKSGEVVGEGSSSPAGGDHAEINALRQAGESARDADVFVTLEPCNHTGRTGPCSVALAHAGVRRVVYAVADPNPQAGGGAETLRQNGVLIESGLLADEAERIHRMFLTAQRQQAPYVVVKAAITLDGFLARPDGTSKWITGEEARAEGHRLRAECGVVLVGRKTVEADDPLLTVRLPGDHRQPSRAVIDPEGRLSGTENVFGEEAETLWFVRNPVDGRQVAFDDVNDILTALWQRGQTGVLVEGGATTIRMFLEAGVVNQIDLFIAPKLFGKGVLWNAGAEVPVGEVESVRLIGGDVHLRTLLLRETT